MADPDSSYRAEPFKALIGASSLIAALLYLAGFAFRWNYFYNFGVPDLVFDLSLQSTLTASMEMIKRPKNFLLTVLFLAGSLLLVNLLLGLGARIAEWRQHGKFRASLAAIASGLGFQNPLVTDCIRALVVFYVVYMLSAQMGYWQYERHVVNGQDNTLPVVAAIIGGEQDFVLACGKEGKVLPNLIGNAKLVHDIQDYDRTCNLADAKWRLLYRDDKNIYLFASREKQSGRPLTIVLPSDKIILVTE